MADPAEPRWTEPTPPQWPVITPASVPPSTAGVQQPIFGSGSATDPATPQNITGSPILPPPLITNPPAVMPPFEGTLISRKPYHVTRTPTLPLMAVRDSPLTAVK
jgi:hypothetical protein